MKGAFLALALALTALSQAGPPQYTFRTNTRLVQIHVVVEDAAGHPVRGLTAADFTLTDNGVPRDLRVFSFNEDRGPGPWADTAGPADAYTNLAPPASGLVVMLLDNAESPILAHAHGAPDPGTINLAKPGILRFLNQLPPSATVAVYGLDTQLRVLADFTSDRQRLAAAVRDYRPHAPIETAISRLNFNIAWYSGTYGSLAAQSAAVYESDREGAEHTRSLVPALRAIADHLAGVNGRVSLVWFLEGPRLAGPQVTAALGRDNIAVYPVDARGLRGFRYNGQGAPNIHVGLDAAIFAMQDLAAATGGRALVHNNGFAQILSSALADSTASYTLGFYLPQGQLDGKYHRLRIAVAGHRRQLLYSHGYWAVRDSRTGGTASAAALAAARNAALRSPLAEGAIPLRASLHPAPGNLVRLDASFAAQPLTLARSRGLWNGAVVYETAFQDAAGRDLAVSRHTVSWQWGDAIYQRRLNQGVTSHNTLTVPPGATSLRVLVQDQSSGALGSLILPLPSPLGQ